MTDIQDNKSDSKEKKIKVAIRVRPVIDSENGKEEVWAVKDSKTICRKGSRSRLDNFQFDRVFDGKESNLDVYNAICKPIIKEVIGGFNATIFAYGQTSSGKTFTMMGDEVLQGVIHYAIADIFEMIQSMTDREFLLRVSVLEIYNQKVYDLLSGKNDDLRLMDDHYGVLNIVGLKERIVQTPEQIWKVMKEGLSKRRTGETQMNRASSRSHFIFRMILESSLKGEEDPIVSVSQLNLVDLAGSEHASQSKNPLTAEEGNKINQSLSTLSKVIKQLSEKPDQFIAYRTCKLTRILQNSLGGNAHTAIICTVTPISWDETQSTLRFASTAIKIKNKPHKNEVLTDQALLKQYANKIKKLSEELKVAKEQGELELEDTKKQNENLKKQIEKLKANFVCQSPQENQVKAARRATFGGLLDRKTFLNSRNTALNSRFIQNLQLPNIYEEEIEGELDLPGEASDLMDSIRHRNSRGTSRLSSSSLSSTSSSKNIQKDAGVQTSNELLEESSDIDELMTMVSDLKSQLTTLQNEFAEHNEYTTLEKQILKAELELQVENEDLKAENAILKRKLEAKSVFNKSCSSFNEFKVPENNLSKNETFESNSNIKQSRGIITNNVCSSNFNSSHISEKCDANKSVKETSLMNVTGSTVMDDSHEQSNFLAFYDECMESETVSKLKSEIEAFKHDIEIKNKQLTLLNDKILIKEQFITSLQDEIALNKNTDSSNDNINDRTEQIHESCQTDFIQMSPAKTFNSEESFKPIENSDVKNTVTKSVQTSQDLDTVDAAEKDRQLLELNDEKNTLLERINYLEEKYNDLRNRPAQIHETCQTDFIHMSPVKTLNSEESFTSFENSCVLKNTVTKSVQTSQNLDIADATEKDRQLLELNNEKNTLLEQINYLVEKNNDLRKDINDINNSDYERIETLKQKYSKELIDQEKHYAEELQTKTQEIKQENLKQLHELKEEIERMKISHSRELSASERQYEDRLASLQYDTTEKDGLLLELRELKEEIERTKLSHSRELSAIKKQYEDQLASVQSDATEKDRLLLELNNERSILLEQMNYLEEKNSCLRKDIDDIYKSDSDRIETLEKQITNTWKIKTEILIKDLEQKYDQDIIDQEKIFAEELRAKTQEIKHESLKQLHELKEEIERMELSHNRELSAIKEQYEDQLASVLSEKQLLKHELETENEKKISAYKEKYVAKQKEFRKTYSELYVRTQHYMEEIEKLKNDPSNQIQVIEKLKEKINELFDERDLLQKKCTRAELQISELKERNNYIKHELEKINEKEPKQSILNKISKLEETNKELLYDLDQKKAKIMTLQSNNTGMLQELKKLKEMQSSKMAICSKCKSNSKELILDVQEKNEDKKDRKSKMYCKDDLDNQGKVTAKQKSIDENTTPQNSDYLDNRTPDQNAILCVGGGSGPANLVKSYWLEGIVHKKDKEIQKLREENTNLKSQIRSKKMQPLINEEKQSEVKEKEVKKTEAVNPPISPLQEVDENITVQLKTSHPYPGGTVPKIPRKHASRDKNGLINKPYDKHTNKECIKKENVAHDWQRPTNSNVNKHEPKTKYDVVNQLSDPDACRQQ